MRRIHTTIVPLMILWTAVSSLHGQEPLGIQGTASYNLIWNSTATPTDPLALAAQRFGGRVAARLSKDMYAGISVGSWTYRVSAAGFPNVDDAVATAVATSIYDQLYIPGRWRMFTRAGAGSASTLTYYPHFTGIEEDPHTRFLLTGGMGIDLGLGKHSAVTLSLDYYRLFGDAHGREIKAAMIAGLGLTMR